MKKNRWLLAVLCSSILGSSLLGSLEALHAAPALQKGAEQVSVSINKANATELETVRGIGPLLAQRIIKDREANGRYEHLEDLVRVPGIGQAKFNKIKDQITL